MELEEIQPIEKFTKWFTKNWEFVGLLLLFSLYMFLANFFMWGQTFLDSFVNFSGGSDPYFNYIIIQYILSNHTTLLHTIGLNYPIGSGNPRNPFFHWMIAFVAVILGPLLGGSSNAAYYAFMEFDAVFGALLIIPVYMLGKSILGKKAGMIGAVLYTLMPSNLSSGILSDGRMHTPELIFAFFAIYFLERAVRFSSKERIIQGSLFNVKSYYGDLKRYIRNNRKATIYALLAGATYGALQLSWQGHAYILAIVTIYVVIQLIVNLFLSRNNEYLVYVSFIFVAISFSMSAYYYYAANNAPSAWFIPPLYIGLGMILISVIMSIAGRKPWIISVPVMILFIGVSLAGLYKFAPHIFNEIISGEGYFIKTRVYQTIAEAQSPPLGQYIGGFGVAQFILGIAGFAYVTYLFVKQKSDSLLLLLVFSGVSIYMSFAAARFNVTAAPSYAILGAALLAYFSNLLKLDKNVSEDKIKRTYRRSKALKGNIKWLQAAFVFLIVFGILIPSGLGVVSAAVPGNSATSVNHEVYNALPSFLKPPSYLANQSAYFGTTGSFITNSTTPLSKSLEWLATQQQNLSLAEKPAYVNWWDYGFQELCQGKHPTVADDFQQAYQVAGQILLSQNQSQIIALMSARLIQASLQENNGQFTPVMKSALSEYLNTSEINTLQSIYNNPQQYVPWILNNASIYGQFIPSISPTNAYFALIKGQLASKVSLTNLVNLYQNLQSVTGWSIQYIQADHSLFPLNGLNTGIFYAPAYLTDTPSYITPGGGVVPTAYYQIFAQTPNGTYPLNQLPTNLIPTGYTIQYTPAFYNTTIYRAMIGLPPTAVGQTQGIPGLTFGTTKYTMQPAWNMSNFELVYDGVPYNPYKNFSAHPNAFKLLPIQQAYNLQKNGIGTAFIFPQVSSIIQGTDPILRYFPGAIVTGQVKTNSGIPESGIRVTIVDQYGIPHQTVLTNSNGYYNITALPGNDTLIYSYGTLNSENLEGKNFLHAIGFAISNQQAERKDLALNSTTGLPNYYLVQNYLVGNFNSSGTVEKQEQNGINGKSYSTTKVENGTVILQNHISGQFYNFSINHGSYNVTGIPQGNYTVSVYSNGITYRDIQDNVYTPDSNIGYAIKIPMSLIQVNLTYNGQRISGATVYAGKYTATTNSTGTALLYTVNGSYPVYAKLGNSITQISDVSIPVLGGNKSLNLALLPAVRLTIGISNQGFTPSVLDIYQSSYSLNVLQLQKNGSVYTGLVPLGYYSVYDTYDNMTVLQGVNVNSSGTYTLHAYSSAILKVINSNENLTQLSGYLSLTNNQGTIIKLIQSLNQNIYLPAGFTYTIYSSAFTSTTDYVATTTVNLNQNTQTYIDFQTAKTIQIGIYNPSVAAVYDSQSSASSGVAMIYLNGEAYGSAIINARGNTLIAYNAQSLSGFTMEAYSEGFSTSTFTVSTQTNAPLNLQKSNVSLKFTSVNGGALLDGKITLVGYSNYTSNIINGKVSFNLPYGSYFIKIFGGNQIISSYQQILTVSTGTYSKSYNFTSHVGFIVNGVQSFKIFNNGTLINEVNGTIAPGTYTVYELGNSMQSGIITYRINSNTTVNAVLYNSYWLNLTNNLGISTGNLLINSSSGLINLTSMSSILPQGSYSVHYYDNLVNSTGEFRIYHNMNVLLKSNIQSNITLSVAPFFTQVNGLSLYSGVSMAAVNVSFYKNNLLEGWTYTTGSGHYNFSLVNGTYTLYAYSKSAMVAYLGHVNIGIFQGTSTNNISLTPANYIYVYTYLGQAPKAENVNLTVADLGISATSGSGTLLPAKNITFTSYISNTVTVNNYTFSNEYQSSTTIYTNKTQTVNLVLQKVINGNVSIKQNYVAQNVSEFSKFSYDLNVTNLLTTEANITLSSGSSNWNITFNTSTLKDLGINRTAYVKANIKNVNTVASGVNEIPILVSYNGGSLTDNVKANMSVNYSASLNISTDFAAFDGGNITYSAILKNTGNTNETLNLSKNIYSKYNWQVMFSINGKIVNSTNLSFGQSKNLLIILVPESNYYNSAFNFTVQYSIYQLNSSTVHSENLYVSFPNLGALYNTAKGGNIIANYTGNPVSTIEIGILVIVIAVIGGLAGVAFRGRKNR
jgi:dolichyl-diphosphooligosaccharide--protein glycosyltransferase